MRIVHPRPELGAQSDLGVDFIDGVATVESLHPERELALLQHGYIIEADPEIDAPYHGGLGEPILDLTKLSKAELRALFPEDADLPAKLTRLELIDRAAALPAKPIIGSTDNGDGSFAMASLDDLAQGGFVPGGITAFAESAGDVLGETYIPLTPAAPVSTGDAGSSDES